MFSRPPADVRQSLPEFRKDVEKALGIPAALNIYDTQFHAKQDGSLDFSSTRSVLGFSWFKQKDIRINTDNGIVCFLQFLFPTSR